MALPARISRDVPGRSAVKEQAKKEREAASHVRLVGNLTCPITGATSNVDAHHLMRPEPGARGMGLKSAGRWTIPLHRSIHEEITRQGDPEAYLMERYGLDARALTAALWTVSPDVEEMERVVFRAFQKVQTFLSGPSRHPWRGVVSP